ncbi:MAG TPA: MlaE family lipid ABC transporter permease subunit [Steroidobacteraceae bacterium]|nr:MlaE family lipid ABC transporter permease subunit [Steroidobacteraceae bacterium]
MPIQQSLDAGTLTLKIAGDLVVARLSEIEADLAAADSAGASTVVFDVSAARSVDISGACLILDRARRLTEGGVPARIAGARSEHFEFLEELTAADTGPPATGRRMHAAHPWERLTEPVGIWALHRLGEFVDGIAFLGRIVTVFGGVGRSLKRLRLPSIARHVYETGVTAMPIVALIAFLISVIVAYLGADQLRKFGAEIFVVDLVTIAVLREMGVLLTAIIVAGRSGSAFAAEIGVMKLNEEVDALSAIGMNPLEILVLPRVIGLVIALPLLTVLADAMGLLGGGLLSGWLVDIPATQYIQRMQESISATTFWAGLVKAPVFAFLIAAVGTYRGMQVRGSSRELGRLTTVAVVQSIFLVILADALFAIIFVEIDF